MIKYNQKWNLSLITETNGNYVKVLANVKGVYYIKYIE